MPQMVPHVKLMLNGADTPQFAKVQLYSKDAHHDPCSG
jgi:hypothetical protein